VGYTRPPSSVELQPEATAIYHAGCGPIGTVTPLRIDLALRLKHPVGTEECPSLSLVSLRVLGQIAPKDAGLGHSRLTAPLQKRKSHASAIHNVRKPFQCTV
jgi:hypothetical protein